ncbi:NHL repeat-containing protein, partial [Motilibacter deserti]
GTGPYVPPPPREGDFTFPGKAVRLPERLGGGFLVSDSGHHSLAVLDETAEKVVRRIGSGQRGLLDGDEATARFAEPQGLVVLPEDVAAEVGYDVVVADTVNHALRGVTLATGQVQTLAGTGRQWMQGSGTADLSSPWDVAWWQGKVWIAMAGIHQLWMYDPRSLAVAVAAGTTNEGLVDGPAHEAWFAQTSGLAADGDTLWIADSETSSLRRVRVDGAGAYVVESVVGKGLFDFGHRDGPVDEALLQHPLGVTVLSDGSVLVSDTYNGALRHVDVAAGTVSTVATGLAEPSDAVLGDEGAVLVVESAGHRLSWVRLTGAASVEGFASRTQRPTTDVAPGPLRLEVVFDPPPGQHLDERWGPATRLVVSSTPPGLLRSGEGRDTGLARDLELDPGAGDGVLHVAAMAASCDDEGGEGAACHVHQQDWGVPVRIVPGAPDTLTLVLSGNA